MDTTGAQQHLQHHDAVPPLPQWREFRLQQVGGVRRLQVHLVEQRHFGDPLYETVEVLRRNLVFDVKQPQVG